MAVDVERVQAAVTEILIAIGEDVGRDGLLNTPRRVAAMYEELFSGLHDDPGRHLEVTFAAEHDEMVMVRDIPFASLCEHHLVPFLGRAHVAYIPASFVVGYGLDVAERYRNLPGVHLYVGSDGEEP